MEMLNLLKNQADDFGVRKIADFLLADPRFPLWSGSAYPKQHHYGTGGLLTHVYEVIDMCLIMRRNWYPKVNAQVLFLSALMHDWGKLWDYDPVPYTGSALLLKDIDAKTQWEGTIHKRRIHHISRSAIEWAKAVALSGECKDIEDEVSHAILSHHGQREWGSPVAPNTHVAWLLYYCDGISARMNDCGSIDVLKYKVGQ